MLTGKYILFSINLKVLRLMRNTAEATSKLEIRKIR
jgi:hypothetical protein